MRFRVEIGVREKKGKRKRSNHEEPFWIGGWTPGEASEKEKTGEGPVWGDQKTARALRVP